MDGKTYLFETAPVPKAVMELAIPTVISQLIAMVYNMADTFFVGQLNDPNQVAAVTLAAPVMLVLTALANLFGIGGAGMISRSLGEKDAEKAKRTAVFSFYTALCVVLLCSVSAAAFRTPFLRLLGAFGDMEKSAGDYIFWVFIIGGAPTMLNMTLAHFVRADGAPRQASIGLSMGGILNMLLDPIFIFSWGFGMGSAGAAVATMISNVTVLLYFCFYFYRRRHTTAISLNPRRFAFEKKLAEGVLSGGLPAMLQTLLASVSNAALNKLASPYGGSALAAFGIAKKIDTIPMNVTIGLSQGVLPLLGYNYAAKNTERLHKAIRVTLISAVGFSLFCVILFQIMTEPIIRIFINEAQTVEYGTIILRVMCLSTPLMAIAFLMITLFQAAGQSRQALVLSVFRKGLIDIPLMFIINAIIPMYGLACVQPVTEGVAMMTALIFYRNFRKSRGHLEKC